MKSLYTSKSKKGSRSYIICLTVFLFSTLNSQTFVQNFNSSTTLTDYFNASPTTHQFDDIATTGAGVTISVANNYLSFARTNHIGYFVRASDFSPSPTGFIIKLDITVSGNSSAVTDAAILYLGSGFGVNSTTPNTNSVYGKFGISFTTTDGTFQINDITNSVSSANLSGTKTIRWILNNTGSTLNYTDPNGNSESLANDKIDIWANTTKLFNDVSVNTATESMTDLKFIFNGGSATIVIDNIEAGFSNDGSALPVELKSFTARSQNNNAILHWKTATETNNSGFEIERSNISLQHAQGARNWERIGFVRGSGTSSNEKNYTFTDINLRNGKYSYRLKQIDLDGTTQYTKTAEVEVNSKNRKIRINPNPFNSSTIINYEVAEKTDVTIKLYDLIGRVVAEILNNELKEVGEHQIKFNASNLTTGVYLVKMQLNKEEITERLVLIK